MAIQWTDVESSQIVRVGYDAETLKAYVAFKSKQGDMSSTYEYDGCSQEEADAIINADSVGRQFAATWKYGKVYRKL